MALLKHLTKEGHKASLSKLQYVQQQVHFLGHDISVEAKKLSTDRVSAIEKIPKPITKSKFFNFCVYVLTAELLFQIILF